MGFHDTEPVGVVTAPAVFGDANSRVTIVVFVGRKWVGHVPMDTSIRIKRTRLATFVREYRPLRYPAEQAARKYIAALDYFPVTEAARRVLEKLCAGNTNITENDLLEQEVEKEEEMATDTVETPVPETKTRKAKGAAKTKASEAPAKAAKGAKAAKAPAAGAPARRGKEPTIPDTAKIKLLVNENPKRGASAERFALYRNGMTVADYLEAGGKRADISWDVNKGFIEVR